MRTAGVLVCLAAWAASGCGSSEGAAADGGARDASAAADSAVADARPVAFEDWFVTAPSYAASASAIAAGDLDGDGDVDLAAAGPDGVSLLLNRGDGTFAPRVVLDVLYASGVAVADLDGDGDRDVVAAGGTLRVHEDVGGGAFALHEHALRAGSVAVADLTGDGLGDILVTAWAEDDIALLVNRKRLEFAPPVRLAETKWARALAFGDLDDDGDVDVVVARACAPDAQGVSVLVNDGTWETRPHVGVLLNRGDGSFAEAIDHPWAAPEIALSDIDGDGRLDVALGGPRAAVALGRGDGTFAAPTAYLTDGVAVSPLLADLEGNVRLDLAVAGYQAGTVNALMNLGAARLHAAVRCDTGFQGWSVAVADLDGDGDSDLAIADPNGERLAVLTHIQRGACPDVATYPTPSGDLEASVAAGDLDEDGDVDLVVASGSANVLFNDGAGHFAAAVSYEASGGVIAIGDVDGDGHPDLVTAGRRWPRGELGVLWNDGRGRFSAPLRLASGADPRTVAIEDLDGDGDGDVVVASFGDPPQDVGGVRVFRSHGRARELATPVAYASYLCSAVAVRDLDGDGRPDIVSDRGVFWNRGDGSFDGPLELYTGAFVAADFDVDGAPDLLGFGESVVLHLNEGHRTFSEPARGLAGQYVRAAAVGDVDGDGRPDLALLFGQSDYAVLFNDSGAR